MKDKDELEIEKILENYKSDMNVLATDKIYQNKLTARFFKNDKTYQSTLILNICLIAIFFIACVSAMVFLGIKSNFDTTQKIIIEIILSLVCLGGIGVMTFILIKKKKLQSVVFEDKTIAFYSNDAIVVLDESNYRINFKDIKKVTVAKTIKNDAEFAIVTLLLRNSNSLVFENIVDFQNFEKILKENKIEII